MYALIIIFLAAAKSSTPVVLTQEFDNPLACQQTLQHIVSTTTDQQNQPAPRVMYAQCVSKTQNP